MLGMGFEIACLVVHASSDGYRAGGGKVTFGKIYVIELVKKDRGE